MVNGQVQEECSGNRKGIRGEVGPGLLWSTWTGLEAA